VAQAHYGGDGPAAEAGGAATGTVSFTGATNGAIVQLSSSSPAVVPVPPETVVSRGGGRSDERPWLDNPIRIRVSSNFGGVATANVTR
jgi:hypothetical protein